ncbi:MAG: flavin-containing monooxygenase [Thermoleophilaceae bacterium]
MGHHHHLRTPGVLVAAESTKEVGAERPEVAALVIGAGAAGLAAAAMLGREGVEAVVLERANAVGASWRARYDGLRLNSVRWISSLPGLRLDPGLGRFVRGGDFAAYLGSYAARHRIDVRHGVTVTRIDREGRGWRVTTSEGPWRAGAVVVGTGYDQTPFMPDWPGRESFGGELVHAAGYRNAAPYVGREVLVAGSGSTGAELALDLARGGARRVLLSVRTPPNLFPRQWLGVPLQAFSLLNGGREGRGSLPPRFVDAVGRLAQRVIHRGRSERLLGRPPLGIATAAREHGRIPVFAEGLLEAVEAGRIEVVGGVEALDGDQVVSAGGRRLRPDAVIAATGYRQGLEGLLGHLGVLDVSGLPRTLGSEPAVPGLYTIGYRLPHLGRMPADARGIARRIARRRRPPA